MPVAADGIAVGCFPSSPARRGVTTFRNNPLTLVGPEISVGDKVVHALRRAS